MSYLRIFLVEDHPQMRGAILALLNQYSFVIGTAEHGDVVAAKATELCPDVIVLDISLPCKTGLQLLPELRRQHPSVGIVMLTNQAEPIFREEAARRGADGYVLKDRAVEELWPAVQNAALVRRVKDERSAKLA